MRKYLRTALVVGLTLGLMAFFLRNARLDSVWAAVRGSRVDLLLASLVATAVSYIVRVERWRRLLQPIGQTSFSSAGRATMIGFAANALLPGRVGEVLRPYVLARREGLSGPAAFATIVLERLFDMLAIVVTVAGFVVLFDPPTNDPELLATLRAGALVSGLAALALLGVVVFLGGSPERADRAAQWCASLAPGGAVRVVTRVVQRFLLGLAVVRHPGPLVVSTGLSLVLWMSISVSMLLTSQAFGLDIPLGGAVILMGMVAIGVAVPTPAGVGGYHAAYQLGATALYGAPVDQAVGAALVMHLIAFGPVTVLGLVFMAQEGLRLGTLSSVSSSEASSPGGAEGAAVPTMSVARSDDEGGAG